MKVYMKRPVTRTYEVLFDRNDLRGFLAELSDDLRGVGSNSLTITSFDEAEDLGCDVVFRIRMTETSNA